MRREYEQVSAESSLDRRPFRPRSRDLQLSRFRAPRSFRGRARYGLFDQFGLWGTGAAWLLLHYFFVQEGPFGPGPHPLEFWSIAAHGAFAFASLWMIGLLWSVHVPAAVAKPAPSLVRQPMLALPPF